MKPIEDDNPVMIHEYFAVLAVVCLAVLPDLQRAFHVQAEAEAVSYDVVGLMSSILVRSMQVVPVLLVIVALSPTTTWKSVGIVRIVWLRDMLVGAAIYVSGTLAYGWTATFVQPLLDMMGVTNSLAEVTFEGPQSTPDFAWLIVGSCANGFAEEIVIRGYLFTRFERFTNSTVFGVIVSSLLFGAYHVYQGLTPAIGITVLGAVYAIFFSRLRTIWPLVIAHAIADVLGILAYG